MYCDNIQKIIDRIKVEEKEFFNVLDVKGARITDEIIFNTYKDSLYFSIINLEIKKDSFYKALKESIIEIISTNNKE